jgi:hypothetical protein
MSRLFAYASLATFLLSPVGCEVIADFKKSETGSAEANSAGANNVANQSAGSSGVASGSAGGSVLGGAGTDGSDRSGSPGAAGDASTAPNSAGASAVGAAGSPTTSSVSTFSGGTASSISNTAGTATSTSNGGFGATVGTSQAGAGAQAALSQGGQSSTGVAQGGQGHAGAAQGGAAQGGASQQGGAAQGGATSTGGANTSGGAAGRTSAANGGAPSGGTAGGGAPSGGTSGDVTPPTVTQITPANGAKGITSDAMITIRFSEAMDQNSVRSALSVSGYLAANLSLSWTANGTLLSITPSVAFSYNSGTSAASTTAKPYTVTVGDTAADLAGNRLSSVFTASFTTLRQITQTVPASVVANFYDYGVNMDGTVTICTGASTAYQLGHTVPQWTGSGDTFGVFSFANIPLPSDLVGISGAVLAVKQTTADGAFYTTGSVGLEELAYGDITATNMTWILGAAVVHDFGTFSTADTTNLSKELVDPFATEYASGQRSFLYQFYAKNGASNTYARYYCDPVTLTVTYVVP